MLKVYLQRQKSSRIKISNKLGAYRFEPFSFKNNLVYNIKIAMSSPEGGRIQHAPNPNHDHNPSHPKNQALQFLTEFLISGTAAVISKTLASPIEVIKIRLQLQAPLIQKKLIEKPYDGIVDCFKRLYKEEGWKAYYKGNLINVIRYFPTQACNFAFKDFYMHKFNLTNSGKKQHSFWQTFKNNVMGGSLAGASTQCFVYPLDYTRTRLTNDIVMSQLGRERQFNGILDCIRKTFSTDGLRGLYRGFVVTCLFMMVYRGIYFGLNASVKEQVPQHYLNNILISFLLSYGVTVTAGVVGYPMDTVRRRMMMSSGEEVRFTSAFQCARHMYGERGLKTFVGGIGANILRGVTGAGVLTIYDMLQLLVFGKKYKTGE